MERKILLSHEVQKKIISVHSLERRARDNKHTRVHYAWGSYTETQILLEEDSFTRDISTSAIRKCGIVKSWSAKFSSQPSLSYAITQASAHFPGMDHDTDRVNLHSQGHVELVLGQPCRDFLLQYEKQDFVVMHRQQHLPTSLHILVKPIGSNCEVDLYISNTNESPSPGHAQWISERNGEEQGKSIRATASFIFRFFLFLVLVSLQL
jgi:hypothetical protein